MSRLPTRALTLVFASGLIATSLSVTGSAVASAKTKPVAKHVLLISVDGLHQSDLTWYVKNNPDSTLAQLVRRGVDFTNAQTPFPSDSFPGMTAPMTGGNPKSTGIYYDDTWNRSLLAPAGYDASGNPNPLHDCSGLVAGTEVTYFEALDKNLSSLDAGQGLSGLPATILALTSNAKSLIDPQNLPRDASCNVVYPDQYIRVNTIMEVAHSAGLLTACGATQSTSNAAATYGKTRGIRSREFCMQKTMGLRSVA